MLKEKVTIVTFLAVLSVFSSCKKKADEIVPAASETVGTSSSDAKGTPTSTGNGSVSGSHFQVNIIGVPKGKSAEMTGGARIFVPLAGSAKIMLKEGPFAVLDANGTDGIAQFQLPSSDPDNDGVTNYSVFARPLGTPGGTSTTTSCATDPLSGKIVCSNASYVSVRNSGKTSFTNVSNQLLYIYADLDGNGTAERYPLFDSRLQDYFWQYDNNGMKVLQVRFYEISTNVN